MQAFHTSWLPSSIMMTRVSERRRAAACLDEQQAEPIADEGIVGEARNPRTT
jgi:hypothetical protein